MAHRYDPEDNQTIRDTKVFNPDGTVAETITETWTYDHSWVASYEVVSDAAPSDIFCTEFTFERPDLNGDGIDPGDPVANIASIRRQRADGSFETTVLDYNANGRLRAIILPDSHPIVRTFYDAAGNRTSVLDAKAHETVFVYDARDRLTEVRALGPEPDEITQFTYDAAGNVTGVTDPKGQTTTYAVLVVDAAIPFLTFAFRFLSGGRN